MVISSSHILLPEGLLQIKEHQDLINKMDRMEEVLKNVADVLAANTNYATLISAPQIKESKLKFIQLSMVDSRRLLVVIVVGNDTVKNVLMNMDVSSHDEGAGRNACRHFRRSF